MGKLSASTRVPHQEGNSMGGPSLFNVASETGPETKFLLELGIA